MERRLFPNCGIYIPVLYPAQIGNEVVTESREREGGSLAGGKEKAFALVECNPKKGAEVSASTSHQNSFGILGCTRCRWWCLVSDPRIMVPVGSTHQGEWGLKESSGTL